MGAGLKVMDTHCNVDISFPTLTYTVHYIHVEDIMYPTHSLCNVYFSLSTTQSHSFTHVHVCVHI